MMIDEKIYMVYKSITRRIYEDFKIMPNGAQFWPN